MLKNWRRQVRLRQCSNEALGKKVDSLLGLLMDIYGAEKLVLKAGKLRALDEMKSSDPFVRLVALRKVVFDNPTLDLPRNRLRAEALIDEVEDKIADIIARRAVEDEIEKRISAKMQERHEEYLREMRLQLVKQETGPENPETLKRYARLEKLETVKLSKSTLEILRPASLTEVVGQESAIKSLISKLVSPFPQHVLLYGPPGTGKTTVARLALEEAKRLNGTVFGKDAPFVEVDGSTLRWDPREITNPLLGSVHDPIYQGARRDLADGGVPEPKLGLVTEAHGGVLFIDEIGELDPILQTKLLKVLEEKRVTFDSSYYDPTDPNVPKYVKKLFEEGAPADFVLIGATTRSPDEISSALRSRCSEVFFNPLTPSDIECIVANAAKKLNVTLEEGAARLISQYTIEGRKAVNLLADAYGFVLYNGGSNSTNDKICITCSAVQEVIRANRLSSSSAAIKALPGVEEVGHVFALGVAGYVGAVLEIEVVVFPARDRGRGSIRFNETAGSMAKDSAFNAASAVRAVSGKDLWDYDVHVNVIGGGNIDGPSAGLAILLGMLSALENKPIRQDIAVTGEVSVQGKVKPVGGLIQKLYGAKQAGMSAIIIPKDNIADVPEVTGDIQVIPVATVQEAISAAFAKRSGK